MLKRQYEKMLLALAKNAADVAEYASPRYGNGREELRSVIDPAVQGNGETTTFNNRLC